MTVLRRPLFWCAGLVLSLNGQYLAQELGASSDGSSSDEGLITIESDSQTADNVTGVVTAVGNVRILYPSRGMVAPSQQAQYFSREGRLVLSGDVDVVQQDGNTLRAERVTYDLEDERAVASPPDGGQVRSTMILRSDQSAQTPLTP